MTRYLLRVEYDGRPFWGWQRQDDGLTVQGVLEVAAARLNGSATMVYGAGRTDAGVHATGQAAHIDLRDDIPARKVADALNAHLRPHPVAVLSARAVETDFHARFDATKRYYRYVIFNRRADLTIDHGHAWRVPYALDEMAMQAGAQHLIGQHDFSTFRDTQCQSKTPVKTLDALDVARFGDRIEVTCSALSFLHKQVRSMVGSLVEVGRGQKPAGWMADILAARDRTVCGPVAPADGLFLEKVFYPKLADQETEQ